MEPLGGILSGGGIVETGEGKPSLKNAILMLTKQAKYIIIIKESCTLNRNLAYKIGGFYG